jgi:deoxyribodipyrimidine photolyase-related protein
VQIKALRLVFGDQLTHSLSSLDDIDKDNDVVLMCEVMEENTHVKHHKQKIIFILSAMRHFAYELSKKGIKVHYVTLDQQDNTHTLDGEVTRAINMYQPSQLVLTEPSEYRMMEKVLRWKNDEKIEIIIKKDNRFLCDLSDFKKWAAGRKQLRMEYFYREMRKKHNILIQENGSPVGGEWNFDKQNRQPLKEKIRLPQSLKFNLDSITKDVLILVDKYFAGHFGKVERFNWAINRKQALKCLDDFIKNKLSNFGNFQDAMQMHEPFLFHSTLSPYLNVGLLQPLEVCEKVEEAYHRGQVPLNSAEGYIRQILGWREYIRGIYWLYMPDYVGKNFLAAKRKLPRFYWDKQTDMNCLREVVDQTEEHAYSHHIQRLMVTGNFALLAGIDPEEVCEWYLIVYADAFDWVELPNTLGMALYADAGLLASKPYAASGKYINKMSDFCGSCRFNPNEIMGESACPFNYLYWDFIARNADKLKNNPRLIYAYANWKKMDMNKKTVILEQAESFLTKLK